MPLILETENKSELIEGEPNKIILSFNYKKNLTVSKSLKSNNEDAIPTNLTYQYYRDKNDSKLSYIRKDINNILNERQQLICFEKNRLKYILLYSNDQTQKNQLFQILYYNYQNDNNYTISQYDLNDENKFNLKSNYNISIDSNFCFNRIETIFYENSEKVSSKIYVFKSILS